MAFVEREETGLLVPDSMAFYSPNEPSVLIDNRTDLPDSEVQYAIADYFTENVAWSQDVNFQTYGQQGSLLARTKFTMPTNVFEEIKLARQVADEDDDIRAVIGAMVSLAFREGYDNQHESEDVRQTFNRAGAWAGLEQVFKRIYREYLIAGQVTLVSLFVRKTFDFTHSEVSRTVHRSIAAPRYGILPAENIRVIGDDMFDNAPLAYNPTQEKMRVWLETFFAERTSVATKRQMARERPIWAALFIGETYVENDVDLFGTGMKVYVLNPRMVKRLKMPCDGPYPRPPLTADFGLLEAKRLLNLMDYSLLQGGSNYIVVVKKGTDQLPAKPGEVEHLRNQVKMITRSGAMVGDHRLTFEIVTPDLSELLNAEKRKLLGRKLVRVLMRVPEGEEAPKTEGEKAAVEIATAVITSDRADLRSLVMAGPYEETMTRNRGTFGRFTDPPSIWFPRIVLQGLQVFTELMLKLRDRGDIPRRYGVEYAGFDYDIAVNDRKREVERGDDEIMIPGDVPFDSPNKGPQDNNPGRTPGGTDPQRRRRTITRTRGETVKAQWDEDLHEVVRVGELTASILEHFPDYTIGRMTAAERRAIEAEETFQEGPVIVVPVNAGHETEDHRIVRLDDRLSMLIGRTKTTALVAKALLFRDEDYSVVDAENHVVAWGFEIDLQEEKLREKPEPEPEPEPEAVEAAQPVINVHVNIDKDGEIKIVNEPPEPKPEE